MPRKPSVSHKVILDNLLDADIFDKKGELKKYNDAVWKILCKDIKLTMAPQSLYLYVYKNTQHCQSKIIEHQKLEKGKSKSRKRKLDPDFQIYNLNNPHKKSFLNFKIFFNEEEWIKLKPVMMNNQKKLQRGWTNAVYQKLFDSQGLRCSYSFKTLSVTGTLDEYSINFHGYCTECHTEISGESINNTSVEEKVQYGFDIKTFGVQKIYHRKKRNLAFNERTEAKVSLANKFATDFREDIQNKRMGDRSYEPANLHDTAVYEKARQEIRNEIIGFEKSMNLFDSTVIKKVGIRKININPFYVVYWSDSQVNFWNDVRDMNLPLSLDATGGLFKSSVFDDIKSHSLLYYAMVVGVESKIVPVLQFITAAHHVPVIEEALSLWIEEGEAKIPYSISTDGSPALQNGVTLAFNKITFVELNLVNFKFLLGMDVELPESLYKSDTPHLLRTLNEWKCFKSCKSDILLFYKRCIAFMTKTNTIDEFRKMALALFVVSQSETVPSKSSCEEHLHFLENVIKTHNCDLEATNSEAKNSEPSMGTKNYPQEKFSKAENELTKYVQEIVDDAQKDVSLYVKKAPQTPNPYCVKKFKRPFQLLCHKFTTWTDVMMAAYGLKGEDINSARSETFFRKRKAQIPRPISLLKFLLFDAMKIESYVNRDYPSVRFRDSSICDKQQQQKQ